MTSKAVKKNGDGAVDHAKAVEIYSRLKTEIGDGLKPNSQRKRDCDLIVHLLSEGGGARVNVFRETFTELFRIDTKRAGQRVRDAMSDLVTTQRVSKTDDKRPTYSLHKTSS